MGRTRILIAFLILSGIFMLQSLAAETWEMDSEPMKYEIMKDSADIVPANQSVALNSEEVDHAHNDDDEEDSDLAEAPEATLSRKLSKHHSSDKSVAGGGVIIGGLITAIFAAVFCYIRVTRRQSSSSSSPPTSDATSEKH